MKVWSVAGSGYFWVFQSKTTSGLIHFWKPGIKVVCWGLSTILPTSTWWKLVQYIWSPMTISISGGVVETSFGSRSNSQNGFFPGFRHFGAERFLAEGLKHYQAAARAQTIVAWPTHGQSVSWGGGWILAPRSAPPSRSVSPKNSAWSVCQESWWLSAVAKSPKSEPQGQRSCLASVFFPPFLRFCDPRTTEMAAPYLETVSKGHT